jgi:hypothetical protein
MTDQEIERRVAAVCLIELCEPPPEYAGKLWCKFEQCVWSPLTDKAQASDVQDVLKMDVSYWNDKWWATFRNETKPHAHNTDKLRAICLCAVRFYKDEI